MGSCQKELRLENNRLNRAIDRESGLKLQKTRAQDHSQGRAGDFSRETGVGAMNDEGQF
jgi:hypothetical protein